MRSFILFNLILLSLRVAAQENIVRGKVTSAGLPVPHVTIKKSDKAVTATDSAGNYLIKNLPEGIHVLKTSIVGYKPSVKSVTVRKGDTVQVDFDLLPAAVRL